MRTEMSRAWKIVCILVVLIALATTTAMAAEYTDTAGHWAEEPVGRWSRYHIIEGYGGAFRPDDTMTRGELAKVISGILGLTELPDANPFTDLDMDQWYAPYVLRCYTAGIMLGDEQRRADPESPITREDAMVMFCRAFGINPLEDYDLSGFTDAEDISDYALGYVKALVAAGIVRGVTETTLCPGNSIDRASVIKLIDGMITRYINEPGSYALAEGSGLIVVAASGEVILTGTTAARIMIAPGCAGSTVTFDGAVVDGAVEVYADDCRVLNKDAEIASVTIIGTGSSVEEPEAPDKKEEKQEEEKTGSGGGSGSGGSGGAVHVHAWSAWTADQNGHTRVCAINAQHVERHVPVWTESGVVDGRQQYTCSVCGLTTDIDALVLTESFPQFYISEYDGTAGGKSVTVTADCFSVNNDADYSFQWYSCDDINGANGAPIDGATEMEYATDAFPAPAVSYYYCEIGSTRSANGEEIAQSVKTGIYAVGYTGLPTVYIDTENGTPITSKDYYLENARFKLVSNAEFAGNDVDGAIEIKGRGNTSWRMPKKGYTFKFGEKTNLFGLGTDKKWAIIANYADKTLLRNWFASDLTAEVWQSGEWNPSYIPVDLILNGEYVGNYTIVDSIKISKSRVNLDTGIEKAYEIYTSTHDTDDLAKGGFVLEIDKRLDASHYFKTSKGVPFTMKDPDLDEADGEKASVICGYVQDYIQTVEDVLYSEGFADPNDGYAKYLDVDSFVDWYLVNELTKNNDAKFSTSVYMYYDPSDGLLHMGPNWDFDLSCGNINFNNCVLTEGFWIKDAKWIKRLFEDPAFAAKVQTRWNSGKEALYDAVNTSIRNKADLITVSAQLNFDRWRILGKFVWPNAAGFDVRTTYQSEVDYLIEWLNARYQWLDTAINNL